LKLIIVHFRKIDIYPPIINLTRFLSERGIKTTLYTAYQCDATFNSNVEVINQREISPLGKRWISVLYFYLRVFTGLVRTSCDLMYFESLSCPPIWFYLFCSPSSKRRVFAHFHEYFSIEEYAQQSFLERWGRRLESKVFHKYSWISHTNSDRLSFFQKEYPTLSSKNLRVMPNYPPLSWLRKPELSKTRTTKLIYIGSISFASFYLRELIDWLLSMKGMFSCDFYSLNAKSAEINFINSLPNEIASFKGAVPYDDLPKILPQYQVGIVMYKIASKNMIFNAPNKLFEYLACGLDVWFSNTLLSTYKYETKDTYPKVVKVDFTNLAFFDVESAISKEGLRYKNPSFVMEDVYEDLYKSLAN
jgi:hypothetical protein